MNLQAYYDFSARHLLTQNEQCMKDGWCVCQSGTLRCALACFALESDVTSYENQNGNIPSIKILANANENLVLLCDLVIIHDSSLSSDWPDKLNNLAIKFKLEPFSPSDLQGRRGIINPLAVWYTNPTQRAKLLKAHTKAGTSHLLADYLKAFPLDTSGVRKDLLPTESQGVV